MKKEKHLNELKELKAKLNSLEKKDSSNVDLEANQVPDNLLKTSLTLTALVFVLLISIFSLSDIFKLYLLSSLPQEYQTIITAGILALIVSSGVFFFIRKIEILKSFSNKLYHERNRIKDKYFSSQIKFEDEVEERNSELSEINSLLSLEIESRKKTEVLLRDSERKYRLIYQHTPVGIFHYDENLVVNDFNEKFSNIFNSSRETLLNSDLQLNNDGNLITALKTGLEGGEGKYDGQIALPDSEPLNVSLTTAPLYNLDDQVTGALGIIQKRKADNENKLIVADQDEDTSKLKTEFLAQVTHEIRSPVHVILSFSDLLKGKLKNESSNDYTDSLDMISRAGNRITRTLELIIYMAEIQAGTYKYLPRFIDLYRDILMRIYFNYRKQAEEKNIKFNILKNTDATFIQVDEDTVYQLFNNLVDNAIKYTANGTVQIIVNRDGSDKLSVSVSDTGIGISEDYLPYIFNSFSQEDYGYSREYEGSGIGLALAEKCCNMNNAEMAVESKKSEGSSFTVKFN